MRHLVLWLGLSLAGAVSATAFAPHGLKVVELAPGVSFEDVQSKTGAPLT